MSNGIKALLGVVGGAVLVLVLLTVFAGSGLFGSGLNTGHGGMMGQGGMMSQGGMMGGWGFFGMVWMLLFPLLFLGGLVALIVWAVTQLGSGGHAASERHAAGSAGVHDQSAEEILKRPS